MNNISFRKLTVAASAVLTVFILSSCATDKEWELVWQEDFNGTELDTELWSRIPRGEADWQNTQSDTDPRVIDFRDGCLILRGIVNDNPDDPSPWLTGGVWTRDKKAIPAGRIEVKARLHKAQGAWPAIWAMGYDYRNNGWPRGGELDIMERLNGDSIAYQTLHTYYTYFVNENRSTPAHGGIGNIDPDDFNIYGVDITPDSIVFHINHVPSFVYHRDPALEEQGQFPFFGDQYLLIDMQLGGAWVGAVKDEDLPVEMEIDWVKAYTHR